MSSSLQSGTHHMPDGHVDPAARFSPDWAWWWDGAAWRPNWSPDGLWRWDGTAWTPRDSGSTARPFRSARTLATWTSAVLAGVALMLLARVPIDVLQYSRYRILQRGQLIVAGQEQVLDVTEFLVSLATLALLSAAVVLFCLWIHRTASNLPALGGTELAYVPGWAVGWFFIPFANLVMPYRVVAEAWRVSDPRVGATNKAQRRKLAVGPLLPAWWTTWVIASFIARATGSGSRANPGAALSGIPGSLALALAAILCALVVLRLTSRQLRKQRTLGLP